LTAFFSDAVPTFFFGVAGQMDSPSDGNNCIMLEVSTASFSGETRELVAFLLTDDSPTMYRAFSEGMRLNRDP